MYTHHTHKYIHKWFLDTDSKSKGFSEHLHDMQLQDACLVELQIHSISNTGLVIF